MKTNDTVKAKSGEQYKILDTEEIDGMGNNLYKLKMTKEAPDMKKKGINRVGEISYYAYYQLSKFI